MTLIIEYPHASAVVRGSLCNKGRRNIIDLRARLNQKRINKLFRRTMYRKIFGHYKLQK